MVSIPCIALVSPATPPTEQELGLVLKQLPLRYPAFKILNYCSTERLSVKKRFDQLWRGITHPGVSFVWSIRGGEGSADLIPLLEEHRSALKVLSPRVLIGFSDVTALLFYWAQTLSWPALHGPSALQISSQKVDVDSMQDIDQLLNQKHSVTKLICVPLNTAARKPASNIQGPLAVGNLTLFCLAQRELWEPQCLAHVILIIEDLGEPTYRVRRALHHLKRVGYFDTLQALVIGDFISKPLSSDPLRDQEERIWLQNFFQEFADGLHCPVYQTTCVGHGHRNRTLQLLHDGVLEYGELKQHISIERLS